MALLAPREPQLNQRGGGEREQGGRPISREVRAQNQQGACETGQDRKAFTVDYTPPGLGDYYLCLESPPYFIPEEKAFWQDYVKEPLHIMAEKGWDQSVGLPVEILPITRPYGWPAG